MVALFFLVRNLEKKVYIEMLRKILTLVFVVLCLQLDAQEKKYTAANAHSHNDYLNNPPFALAYENNFGSIEADVFPVNGVLLVAHSKKELDPQRTLKSLYLDPLLKAVTTSSPKKVNLLIDIKEDYSESLALLVKELSSLKQYLSTKAKSNYITIVISGARPTPGEYKKYPGYIFFDNDQKLKHSKKEWKRVALVSLPFNKISMWNGTGDLLQADKLRLGNIIDSVHRAGKPIRFWAAPDTELSWKAQMQLGADLIGTDKITELGSFIKKQNGLN